MRRDCEIWGILNVTPDSFSDGGVYFSRDRAVERGLSMRSQGASVIDVGGQSSRPKGAAYGDGAPPVSVEEELSRVVPVITALVRAGCVVSVDTTTPAVASAAVSAGARWINDVSCGRTAGLLAVAAETEARVVLMHTRGRGQVDAANTSYTDVIADVARELAEAVACADRAGVSRTRIWLDPGLGFAKTADQSARLLACVDRLTSGDLPVLVGASRKNFLAEKGNVEAGTPAPRDRVGASVAAAVWAASKGAAAVRVHDVRETAQALALVRGLRDLEAAEAT